MRVDDTIAELGAEPGDLLEIHNELDWKLLLLEKVIARRAGERLHGEPLGAKIRILAAPSDCADLVGREGRAFDILCRSILTRPGYSDPKPKKSLFNKNRLRVVGQVQDCCR